MRLFDDWKTDGVGSRNVDNHRVKPATRVALAVVRAYQLSIRPLLSGQCRYLPTCSQYAAEAIATHGALRGGWMGMRRVMRCHPFGGSGLDPVPQLLKK